MLQAYHLSLLQGIKSFFVSTQKNLSKGNAEPKFFTVFHSALIKIRITQDVATSFTRKQLCFLFNFNYA